MFLTFNLLTEDLSVLCDLRHRAIECVCLLVYKVGLIQNGIDHMK